MRFSASFGRVFLTIAIPILTLAACNESTGPVSSSLPQGRWQAVSAGPGDAEKHTTVSILRDSGSIVDSFYVRSGSSLTLDSVHTVDLELTPSGDGYYSAVERHSSSTSDQIKHRLRYWYFFTQGDSLYYYVGMRFRGGNASLKGDWGVSAEDSAFLGQSYHYRFTDDSVTIVRRSPSETTTITRKYVAEGRTLEILGPEPQDFGTRYEIVPGLALYITSPRVGGFAKR